jgi:hypothetical protein
VPITCIPIYVSIYVSILHCAFAIHYVDQRANNVEDHLVKHHNLQLIKFYLFMIYGSEHQT